MPRTRKPKPADVPDAVLDEFAPPGPLTAADVEAAMRRFKKALWERALGAELTHHLGYPPGGTKPDETPNHRNGTSGKTVLTDDGPLALAVPRDRAGTFEPQLIPKHERRFTGFDDKILALYARGMTVREIQAFLAEMYAVEVSPDLISTVTDAVVAEVTAWHSRPLEPMYPVVFFDALRVKIRDEGTVRSKAVYLALAVLPDGSRDILGIWIEQTEGAKFWLKVFTDLQTRGCQDILIAVTEGLKGMSEALAVVYPATTLQTCIVHLLRHSLDFANWKERKPLARAAGDLHGPECGGCCCRAGRVRAGTVGREVSHGRRVVAPRLAARDSVLRVSARRAPGAVHHQRAGERARAPPEDHQNSRALPQRRGRDQADLARLAQHQGRVGQGRQLLAPRDEAVCDSLRGSLHGPSDVECPCAWTLPTRINRQRPHTQKT